MATTGCQGSIVGGLVVGGSIVGGGGGGGGSIDVLSPGFRDN